MVLSNPDYIPLADCFEEFCKANKYAVVTYQETGKVRPGHLPGILAVDTVRRSGLAEDFASEFEKSDLRLFVQSPDQEDFIALKRGQWPGPPFCRSLSLPTRIEVLEVEMHLKINRGSRRK